MEFRPNTLLWIGRMTLALRSDMSSGSNAKVMIRWTLLRPSPLSSINHSSVMIQDAAPT